MTFLQKKFRNYFVQLLRFAKLRASALKQTLHVISLNHRRSISILNIKLFVHDGFDANRLGSTVKMGMFEILRNCANSCSCHIIIDFFESRT